MNKIDLNTITYEQIVKILGIFNKMLESGLLEVDFEKSTAYLNIDDCSAYLEQQIKKLNQENGNLKKQYCERTDCSGRIGNSKKIEELQQENRKLKERMACLERSNDRREDTILELRDDFTVIDEYENQRKKFIKYLEDMLEDENDIFSVVRVKDVLSKYKEIIGGLDDKID